MVCGSAKTPGLLAEPVFTPGPVEPDPPQPQKKMADRINKQMCGRIFLFIV